MELNDLFAKQGLDPKTILVMRHQPTESDLRKILPWLAAERPELYNAYQRAQNEKAEHALLRAAYLASFVAFGPGQALFVGLYRNLGSQSLSYSRYWAERENQELKSLGMTGFRGDRPSTLWFDLERTNFYGHWTNRLLVAWPGGERSWWRWADRNAFPIDAILPKNAAEPPMPSWNQLVLTYAELKALPSAWKAKLSEWRGIYFILDSSDGRGYVGSAYGAENILGRWLSYASSGHGGNKELRKRDPANFRFSILERVSPDALSEDVIRAEGEWKARLSTRDYGLNEN